MINKISLSWMGGSLIAGIIGGDPQLQAQTISPAQAPPTFPRLPQQQDIRPPQPEPSPLPSLPPLLPLPGELLPTPPPELPTPNIPGSNVPGSNVPATITVKRFEVKGSTVFRPQVFEKITQDYVNKPISLPQLFEVRTKITELYFNKGYITSGAYIPLQALDGGVVTIQISEGGLEGIVVKGNRHLHPDYIRSRLAIATGRPLKQKRLLAALQLLQQNPLIQSLSASLSPGTKAGENLLEVTITEAPIWNVQSNLDNGRTPSVGTFRRQLQLSNANLLGFGDGLSLAYTNTTGSNAFDASYTLPINPRNGTISISGGFTASRVIESPFDVLDIRSNSNYIDLTVRQPILLTPTHELALGLTASRRESGATLLGDIPFPAPGSDNQGNTRLTTLRFFQEYTRRDTVSVLALRSQFSLRVGALNTTINSVSPEGNFLVWNGQVQYVRRLGADSLLALRGNIQLANQPLIPLEQFGIGGQDSVRGYRQDQLFTDGGAFASAEVRIPILRLSKFYSSVLQLTPFIEGGYGFNRGGGTAPSPNTLLSAGLGLRLQVGSRITARFDWGIPLTQIPGDRRTLQEQGFYFSLLYNQPL